MSQFFPVGKSGGDANGYKIGDVISTANMKMVQKAGDIIWSATVGTNELEDINFCNGNLIASTAPDIYKLSPTGKVMWTAKEPQGGYFSGPASYSAVDDSIVAMVEQNNSTTGFGISKISNSDGTILWTSEFNLPESPRPVVSSDGSIYVTGYAVKRSFMKFSKDGDILWQKDIYYPGRCAVDSEGNPILSSGKYSKSGELVQHYPDISQGNHINGILVDYNDNIIIGINAAPGGSIPTVAKLDAKDGKLIWSISSIAAKCLAHDLAGDVYVTDSPQNTIDNAHIHKLSGADGSVISSMSVPGCGYVTSDGVDIYVGLVDKDYRAVSPNIKKINCNTLYSITK